MTEHQGNPEEVKQEQQEVKIIDKGTLIQIRKDKEEALKAGKVVTKC